MEKDDYTRLPRDKAELMARIEREWDALQDAIAKLSNKQLSVPDAGGWAIKDNLAHLATWERWLCLYHLGHQPPHEVMQVDKATFEQLDQDGLNAVIFERNKTKSVQEVKSELAGSHAEVLADLARLSYQDLMQPRYPDDPEAGPVMNWVIGNTCDHYAEHRASIEQAAKRAKK